jgi:hypothetical protein
MQIAELENRSSKNIVLVRTQVAVAEQNSLSLSTAYYTTTSTRLRNKFQIWQRRFAVGNLALQKCAQSPGCTKLISAFAQSPRRTNSHLFFPFPFSHRPVLVSLPTIQRAAAAGTVRTSNHQSITHQAAGDGHRIHPTTPVRPSVRASETCRQACCAELSGSRQQHKENCKSLALHSHPNGFLTPEINHAQAQLWSLCCC